SSRCGHVRCLSSTSSTFASCWDGSPSSPGSSTRKRNAAPEKRLVVARGKAGGGAGLVVEGRLQLALEIARHKLAERLLRDQAASAAELVEPAHAGCDMIDLVAIDAADHCSALRITDAIECRCHVWCHIEPARFEHK